MSISKLVYIKIYKSYMLLEANCKVMLGGQALEISYMKLVAIDLMPSLNYSIKIK